MKGLSILLEQTERLTEVSNESEDKHTSLDINIVDTGVPLASCESEIAE